MTENIFDYKFDLDKEDALLTRAIGAARDYMSIVQLNVGPSEIPGAPNKIGIDKILHGARIGPDIRPGILNLAIDTYQNPKNISKSSSHFPTNMERNGKKVCLVVMKNDPLVKDFGNEYAEVMRLWIFLHEIGHARCGLEGKDQITREIAADSYSVLFLLDRFGPQALPIISQISWLRSLYAVNGSTSHLTSFALDKIAVDYKAGKLSHLDEGRIIALSQSYARDWTPQQQALTDVENKFSAIKKSIPAGKGRMEKVLTQTFLSSPNALGNYVVAKVLVPLVQPGATYKGKTIDLPEANKFRTTIREQYSKTGLSAHFDAKAAHVDAPTMLKMLQTNRFKGKPLRFNPAGLS